MKQSLQLKLSQHLALTPQLQQSIRLLQLSTLELNQELDKFLEENPLLEREDAGEPPEILRVPQRNGEESARTQSADGGETGGGETSGGETGSGEAGGGDAGNVNEEPARDSGLGEGDWLAQELGGFGGTSRDDDEGYEYAQGDAVPPDLRAHLRSQLGVTKLSDRDRCLVSILIDSVNDEGYLTQDLAELAELLPPEVMLEADEFAIALKQLQSFEPTGVGARSVAECLSLQLAELPADTPARSLAIGIVAEHLAALAGRDFAKLRRLMRCTEDELRAAQTLIRSLNPRPGAAFAPADTRYVVPDVIVRKQKNVWTASLNQDAIPRLRINRMYAEILQSRRGGGGMSGQLQEARWLIKNVQQRFETILRVSQAIVDRQRHFFEHGEVAMRPLVLREIADLLGLHESTVSRVTTQKYMLTPRGIFELKYFFGSHVATEAGGACSATAIRALIRQLVGAESGVKPLSDNKISQILGQQGIVVARRTIAKYRESLHIPPVSLRKSL